MVKYTCAAQHLCGAVGTPIEEHGHLFKSEKCRCAVCDLPMHGGGKCGSVFSDIRDSLDQEKLLEKRCKTRTPCHDTTQICNLCVEVLTPDTPVKPNTTARSPVESTAVDSSLAVPPALPTAESSSDDTGDYTSPAKRKQRLTNKTLSLPKSPKEEASPKRKVRPNHKEEEDTLSDEEVNEMFLMFSKLRVDDKESASHDDIDTALKELSLACSKHVESDDDMQAKRRLINGWLSMEDNDFSIDAMTEEGQQLCEYITLRGLVDTEEEEIDKEEMTLEELFPKELPTIEVMDQLATTLKQAAVAMADWPPEFRSAIDNVEKVCNQVRQVHKKLDTEKTVEKQRKAKQPGILGFLNTAVAKKES
ncbi:hypothetical protein THAOC_08175 [Thalassiosira oceanica]|uniref:Uncharacterized protein n=1 Tax=Thalassiosira oceanica TaxID=159749 RepID=K0SZQ3_THAOC|nr:hypothetical protein THAOC_08175 [Thalassiosira oceanica]|eukprot:EJK70464.1 hypothetical protein THAOC_08175 [Thalassiosira oceanica]